MILAVDFPVTGPDASHQRVRDFTSFIRMIEKRLSDNATWDRVSINQWAGLITELETLQIAAREELADA